jgi:ADP-heptose:LPS heptosyltransferase
LAFIAQADMVIGPETGVLNAAANEPIPKILFLSHSTEENLSRDWTNTVSLYGIGTRCPGRDSDDIKACNLMHYGWDHCLKNEEHGVAQCQVDISVDSVMEFAMRFIDEKLPDRKYLLEMLRIEALPFDEMTPTQQRERMEARAAL